MTKEEIQRLAERIVAGEATDEDIQRYNQALNFISAQKDDEAMPSPQDKDLIRSQMMAAIHERITVETKVVRMHPLRWVAAAAIVIALGATLYWLVQEPKVAPNVAQQKSTSDSSVLSIMPGGNKATLTLANGKVIMLDSNIAGSIAQQGNVTILKMDSGKIAYNLTDGNTASDIGFNTISTPVGGQYQIILADGSKVWLNAASSLRFPSSFVGQDRRVELTGEGYFEVARNSQMPFKVSVNNMEVEVLGTHFNINSYTNELATKTTLLEGKVRVNSNNKSVVLAPLEQLAVDDNNAMLKTSGVDVSEVVAWKEGRFRFTKMPVTAIMRQVARWYNVDVEYNGPVSKELFSGDVSRQDDVKQLLEILSATNMVSFTVEGRKIIVNPKK